MDIRPEPPEIVKEFAQIMGDVVNRWDIKTFYNLIGNAYKAAAIELFDEHGVPQTVYEERVLQSLKKEVTIWESLPGNRK